MTTPATQITNYRPDLAGALEEFDLEYNEAGFVGLKIAPVIEVDRQSGQYAKIPLAAMLQSRDARRNSDGSYPRISGTGDKDTYATEDYGLEERVDDRRSAIYSDMWDSEVLAAQRVRYSIMEAHEQRVIDAVLGSGTPLTSTASGALWSVAGTDVIAEVRAAKLRIRAKCGKMPNVMVVDEEVIEYLLSNTGILDRYVGASDRTAKSITVTGLAAALNLDEIVVSKSLKNTAVAPKAAVLASQWDKTVAMLLVRQNGAGNRDTRRPRLMNTFHWSEDGSQVGGTFETYRDEKTRGDIVRNRMETVEKIVYSNCAELITTVL